MNRRDWSSQIIDHRRRSVYILGERPLPAAHEDFKRELLDPMTMLKSVCFICLLLCFGCTSQPPKYLQHILSPDGTEQFVLYTDIAGFNEATWYVLKLGAEVDVKKVKIPKGFTNASTDTEKEWMDKTLFWNWSEAGHHRSEPSIKIAKGRYLVFVRGGLNHALYDIQSKTVRVAEGSPWHGLVYSDEYEALDPKPSHDGESKLMDSWVRKHLHDPIEQIINE